MNIIKTLETDINDLTKKIEEMVEMENRHNAELLSATHFTLKGNLILARSNLILALSNFYLSGGGQ